MFGYIADNQFDLFKARWEGIAENGVKSEIFSTCKMLASTDEIVPILFSGGYKDVKNTPKYRKVKVTNKMIFSRYILFGVKSGHTQLFTRFDEWRNNLVFDDWLKTKPTLSAGMLDGGPFIPELDRVYFNYWMLEFKYKLSNSNRNHHLIIDPPWMHRMWGELVEHITKE